MADYPVPALGGKTPLQVARKPNMDATAAKGRSGLLKTVPDGMNPGSETAILSLLGYDPQGADYRYPWVIGKNHIALGAEKEIGTNDLSQIEVRGLSIADVRYDIPPTHDTEA